MKSQVLQGFMIILQLIAVFEFISTIQFTINFISHYCLKSHLFHLFLYSVVKLSCSYANIFKQRGNLLWSNTIPCEFDGDKGQTVR